jgi:hypothetical protein
VNIQIELWHLLTFLIGLLLSFLGFSFAIGKFLLGQVKEQLDERFKAQEAQRAEAGKHWDTKFASLESSAGRDADKYAQLERDLLNLKADLPERYVRREDWIRFAAVIDAKQDALSEKLNTLNARLAGLLENVKNERA